MNRKKDFYIDLQKLISFKSVKSQKTDDAPFGEEIKQALLFMLDRAKEFGFKTINYDNYIGEVVFGQGEEVGIIGHLDVVPEGSGWDTPPYTLTEKEGVLYGRGLVDNKLPMLISLYILKEFLDQGITPNRKIRLFIGCDEECSWQDVDYLATKTKIPEYGFSPDGNFPISYAEKGIFFVDFKISKLKNFENISGGTVINAVCPYATCNSKISLDKKILDKYNLKLTGNKIESFGVASHGSRPELGKNALKPLFEFFYETGEDVGEVLSCLFNDKYKISSIKTEQGNITLSPDIIEENENEIIIKCDCRVPAPLKIEDVKSILDKFNIEYTITEKHPPMMVEKQGFLVSALSSAYNSVTNQNTTPVAQGGSTFARVFKKGVAFGPEFPDEPSSIHEANEHIKVESVEKLYNIYKQAILNLIK